MTQHRPPGVYARNTNTTGQKRNTHSTTLRAKVALAAIREQETFPEIARRHKLHANMVYKWKRQLLDNLARAMETGTAGAGNKASTSSREAELLQKIGELTVDRDFLSNGLG